MADNLEAPNPFNQTQLQEGDSLNFESNFWKEQPIASSAAYDDGSDDNDNNNENNNNNKNNHKTNAITSLFNNMKSKLKESPSNGVYQAYDDNAYDDNRPSDDNAYEAEATKESTADSKTSKLLSTNQITMTHEELDKKEVYLDKREKQLLERKRRLEAVKHELGSSNIRRDNWPCTYYPITFHSIQQEIPPHARSHMKRMYSVVLLTFLCFTVNTFAELVLYLSNVVSDSSILLAVLYLFCGVCGAWRLWYRQIYYGIRDRKTMKWWCFFIFFAAHIGFCVCMSLGIEGWGGAGFITMVNSFKNKKSFSGFVCLITSCFWCMNALASCFYMKRSWVLFKQRGGVQESTNEVASMMARHAVDQLV